MELSSFLTDKFNFLQEKKIVVVKTMQRRNRYEQAEQSNTLPGPEKLPKSLVFVVPYWRDYYQGIVFKLFDQEWFSPRGKNCGGEEQHAEEEEIWGSWAEQHTTWFRKFVF